MLIRDKGGLWSTKVKTLISRLRLAPLKIDSVYVMEQQLTAECVKVSV